MTARRHGLRTPMRKADLDAIARAEQIAAAGLQSLARRGPSVFQRRGDPPGTIRLPLWQTAFVHDRFGICIEVRGFVDGVEDRGLHCNGCPLSDLVIVEDLPF